MVVKMTPNLHAGLDLFNSLMSATTSDKSDDTLTLNSIQTRFQEIESERSKRLEGSREQSKNLMKKVEQSKIASSRPSYQTSEMVASRMADLESEKFKAAKQITELEQEIASLERDIVQLKEKNFLLDHEANSLDLKYQLIHRWNMYGHLGFEAIADPNFAMVYEKVRVKCAHLNDVFTVPLEHEKFNRFENANRLWGILLNGIEKK